MKYRINILLCLIALLFSCSASDSNLREENNEDDLVAQTQLVWNRLIIFDNDSNLYDSPMRYYAKEFNQLVDTIIEDTKMGNLNEIEIFNRITLLKDIANSSKINDSINEKIQTVLSIDYEKGNITEEIRSSLLKANYLYTLQMTTALERIKNEEDTVPYLIADNEFILKNEEMFAVLIIPNRDLIEFITFDMEQDSIKLTTDSNHFIKILAEPRSDRDSISATLKLQGVEGNIYLTKHYRVIQ